MSALKLLKELDYNDRSARWPEGYEWACPKNNTRLKDTTANGLTYCIIRYLQLLGYQAERISSSGRMIKRGGKMTYIPGTSTNGTADIGSTIKGRSVKIEVKIGRDRQSDAQKKYQADVERAGGIYYIAVDFETFYNWLHNEYLPTID